MREGPSGIEGPDRSGPLLQVPAQRVVDDPGVDGINDEQLVNPNSLPTPTARLGVVRPVDRHPERRRAGRVLGLCAIQLEGPILVPPILFPVHSWPHMSSRDRASYGLEIMSLGHGAFWAVGPSHCRGGVRGALHDEPSC